MATVPPQSGPPPLGQPSRSWFSRHPVLAVGGGCAILCGAALTFVLIMVVLVFGVMRNSDPAKMAIQRAEANPVVASRLGTPLKTGLFVSGNVNVNGASGDAQLQIPVTGPRGKGTIYLIASKSLGRWEFSALEIALNNDTQRIDLLQPALQVQ